jgi:hypothetical protein
MFVVYFVFLVAVQSCINYRGHIVSNEKWWGDYEGCLRKQIWHIIQYSHYYVEGSVEIMNPE